ncbi:tRNA glutamyl-Q(34) synthetase GluQRS [Paraglaciecola aquimarina]|uniref:tRNA glutamyl-Q(34) synthetase GluQRS n=1 Tax=Paraglaciecola aquimarina TaxID=1235557 RepID=A0ABU3SUM5_9ALTE|nr:tRNA glutamyl-Q(34) synthetase GluQRS [Paraglaciecola aquimarina]MDU0353692.1 tRNA glutamyl-Q(34) synthetase GluQRS [Paraglaciecola aquimarina]
MAIQNKVLPSVNTDSTQYVGRFAPSPSGPLHFGSLVTAVGSYLQAKKNEGKWLLRIEDIDPPREIPGAADNILKCLAAHHLYWDDSVVYQSQRSELYLDKLDWLAKHGHTYLCACTRSQLLHSDVFCLCDCVNRSLRIKDCAIRFKHSDPIKQFNDQVLGQISFKPNELPAQFTLRRKDGLFAYQLAVVVDDIEQGISEVARGADLLSATAFQLSLYRAFQRATPKFLHFPVVVSKPGMKLSKQNHAPGIDNSKASSNIIQALAFLGLSVPKSLMQESCANILQWAIAHWDIHSLLAEQERIDNRIELVDSI